ncbi:MAG: protein kinase, partial [Planctomycetes bacterium]|nr:protein kinase [Planctomycetota bacterium]
MFQLAAGAEPIAGYQLLSRLGAGGYGEVWKVTAPGDLAKAMKFVYGRMDDVRAARELKALSRIKQVRHPFLLSLERFEIINGQLVIVTELADMSLLERYEQCRKEGQTGIPRDELLTHLHDAADALDYMSENHGLQHLDIKPENLLLVGGRVKVADFGLVKDLHDGMATLIGGVTPVYAAPEAFDGRASRFSDQYSLAVTYQEMLTGVRPFPGTTAAQLAIQHTNSPPLLSPLAIGDRPAIARALAKDPEKRFASCRDMVDNLQRVDRPHTAAPESATRTPVIAKADDAFDAASVTQATGKAAADAHPPRPISDTRPASRPIAATRPDKTLPPLAFSIDETGLRPTVFLGVGGTGASTLRRLRQRLVDRFVDLSRVPAFQLLLLDTDPRES